MTDPRRYAILIGNSEFPEAATLDALRCPPRDIQGMREVLLARAISKTWLGITATPKAQRIP